MNPKSKLTSVDLPLPVPPIMATFSPAFTSNETSDKTSSEPSAYANDTLSNKMLPLSAGLSKSVASGMLSDSRISDSLFTFTLTRGTKISDQESVIMPDIISPTYCTTATTSAAERPVPDCILVAPT